MSSHLEVAKSWVNGHKATSGKISGKNSWNGRTYTRMQTDGQTLWSYDMIIGVTLSDGSKHLLQARYSVATKHHVQKAWAALWQITGHEPELGHNLHKPNIIKGWDTFPEYVRERLSV